MTDVRPCGCPPFIMACAHSINPGERRVVWLLERDIWLNNTHACHTWGAIGRYIAVLFIPEHTGCCFCPHAPSDPPTEYVATVGLLQAREHFAEYERRLAEVALI